MQDKPKDFADLYASIHPDPSARAKVPILEHGDEVRLIESAVCAEYVAEAFPGQVSFACVCLSVCAGNAGGVLCCIHAVKFTLAAS